MRFSGPSAEAVAKSKIGIGDEVVLDLKGAAWVQDGGNTRTPGRSVDGELVFGRTLGLKITKAEGEVAVEVSEPTPPRSPVKSTQTATPGQRTLAGLRSSLDGARGIAIYSSPAFVKRLRLSEDSFLDSAYDPFSDGGFESRRSEKRQRLSYSNVGQWRYADRSPSPTREAMDLDVEEETPAASVPGVAKSTTWQPGMPIVFTDGAAEAERARPATVETEVAPVTPADDRGELSAQRGVQESADLAGTSVVETSAKPSEQHVEQLERPMPPPPLPRLQMPSEEGPIMSSPPNNVETDDGPSTPVLQPISSVNLPLPSPFPTDTPRSLSMTGLDAHQADGVTHRRVTQGERASPSRKRREMQEVQDTYAEPGASISSPVRDTDGAVDGQAAGKPIEDISHYSDRDNDNDELYEDDSNVCEAPSDGMDRRKFDGHEEQAVKQDHNDSLMFDQPVEAVFQEDVRDLYDHAEHEGRGDDDVEEDLQADSLERGSPAPADDLPQLPPRSSLTKHAADKLTDRPSYLSSGAPHVGSDAHDQPEQSTFGLDGTSRTRQSTDTDATPNEQNTPQSERDRRMAETYRRLFGFSGSAEETASKQPPKSMTRSPNQSAMIQDRMSAAARWTPSVLFRSSATSASHNPPKEHHFIKEETNETRRSAGLDASAQLSPTSSRSRAPVVIDLGSSSDEEEGEEEQEEEDTNAPDSPAQAVTKNEPTTSLVEPNSPTLPSDRELDENLEPNGQEPDVKMIEPVAMRTDFAADEPVTEGLSTPERAVDAGSAILETLQSSPPAQRTRTEGLVDQSFELEARENLPRSPSVDNLDTAEDEGTERADEDLAVQGSSPVEPRPATPERAVAAGSAALDVVQPTPPSQRIASATGGFANQVEDLGSPSATVHGQTFEEHEPKVIRTQVDVDVDEDMPDAGTDDEDTPRPSSSQSTVPSAVPLYADDGDHMDEEDPPQRLMETTSNEPVGLIDAPEISSKVLNEPQQAPSASSSFARLSSTPSYAAPAPADASFEVEHRDLSQADGDYWSRQTQTQSRQRQERAAERGAVPDSEDSPDATLAAESSRPSTREEMQRAPFPFHTISTPKQVDDNLQKYETLVMPSQELGTQSLRPRPSVSGSLQHEQVTMPSSSPPPGVEDAIPTAEDDEDDTTPYCHCQQPSSGNMVACDNPDCTYQWFHWSCVGLNKEPVGDWFCPTCRASRVAPKITDQTVVIDLGSSSSPVGEPMAEDEEDVAEDDALLADFVQEQHLHSDEQVVKNEPQPSAPLPDTTKLVPEEMADVEDQAAPLKESSPDAMEHLPGSQHSPPSRQSPASRHSLASHHSLTSQHGHDALSYQLSASQEAVSQVAPSKPDSQAEHLPQTPKQSVSYPLLPLSPSLSQSQPEQPAFLSQELQPEKARSMLPPTPQLTQHGSSGLLPVQDVVEPQTKPSRRSVGRRSLTARLSGVPEALSAWFAPRVTRNSAKSPTNEDNLPHPNEINRSDALGTVQIQPDAAPTAGDSPRALRSRLRRSSTGLSTPLAYFTPLSLLEKQLNIPSQSHGSGAVDILAVVVDGTKKPERAKGGPRDFFTVFHVTERRSENTNEHAFEDDDVSTGDQLTQNASNSRGTRVEVFRPWKASLPTAEAGDVVLLRSFVVKSRKRQPYLLSCDSSAWCVWRFNQPSDNTGDSEKPAWARKRGYSAVREEVKGPPVEYGERERERVRELRAWWESVKKDSAATGEADEGEAGQARL